MSTALKRQKTKKKERKETHPTAKEVLQWAHVHGFQWTLSVPHHPDVTGLIDWWNGLLKTQLLAAIPYMTRARFSSGLHMLWIGVQYMALFLPQPRFTGPGIKGWMWEWQYSLLPLVTYQQFFFFFASYSYNFILYWHRGLRLEEEMLPLGATMIPLN